MESSEGSEITTALTFSLPLELQERLIDFLHDDSSSLANCSLVCHRWITSTRFHLFKEIILENDVTIQSLHSLINSPVTTIPRCINILSLVGSGKHQSLVSSNDLTIALLQVLFHFTTIRHELYLGNANFVLSDPGIMRALIQMQGFRRLVISHVIFQSFSDFLDILRHGNRIRLLYVFELSSPPENITLSGTDLSLDLEYLSIGGSIGYSIARSLLNIDATSDIKVLRMCASDIVAPLASIMESHNIQCDLISYSPHIIELEIQCSHIIAGTSPDFPLKFVDLSTLRHIRYLRFRIILSNERAAFYITQTLFSLTSPSLEVITLAIYEYNIHLDWSALDDLLASEERFPNLRKVRYVRMRTSIDQTVGALPKCRDRGLLYVITLPEYGQE